MRGQAASMEPGTSLVASWWCAEEGDNPVLPNPWDDRSGISLYERLAHDLRLSLTRQLADGLNDALRVRRPIAYWDLLLGPWLADTVTSLLERRLLCLMIEAAAPTAELLVLPAGPPPRSMAEGLATYIEEHGNAQLFDRIASVVGRPRRPWDGPLFTNPSGPRPPSRLQRVFAEPSGLARRAGLLATQTLMNRESGRRVLMLGNVPLNGTQPLQLARHVRGLRWLDQIIPVDTWLPVELAPSAELRGVLAGALEDGSPHEREIARALVGLLPLSVVEGHHTLVDVSAQSYGPACPTVIGAYHADELRNEYLGRVVADGYALAFVQHGGGYRQFAVNPTERLELRDDTTFVSWGWEGRGAVALPSPRLSQLRDTHRGGDAVTIIEVVYYLTVLRFASVPLADQVLELSRLPADFADAIRDPDVLRNLALKRYPAGYGVFVPRDPRLERIDSARFRSRYATDWMRRSRLVVVTYPDTTFIEALTMNVPTIGLWNQRSWELRDDAAPFFDRLAELGVVHEEAENAARKAQEVYADASQWWRSPDVQDARRAFLDRFGRSGEWLPQWAAFLNDLPR